MKAPAQLIRSSVRVPLIALVASSGCSIFPDITTPTTSGTCKPVFIWTCPGTGYPAPPTPPPTTLVEGTADLGIEAGVIPGFTYNPPAWSADGSEFFVANTNIEAVNTLGVRRFVAPRPPSLGAFRVAADGERVHFTAFDAPSGPCGFYRAGATGEDTVRLATVSGPFVCAFEISLDQRYVTTAGRVYDLMLGTNRGHPIGRPPRDASPSGLLVSFVGLAEPLGPREVRTMRVTDGVIREVWTPRNSPIVTRRLLDVRWNGEILEAVILFDSIATAPWPDTHSIRIVNTDTGEERPVAEISVASTQVQASSWSRDGRALALWVKEIAVGSSPSALHVVATDGAGTFTVIARPFWGAVPALLSISTDGRAIATVYGNVFRMRLVGA